MNARLNNLFDRLRPARWRRVPQITARERFILWKQVAPGDPGLRAVVDLLGDVLQGNADASMDGKRTDTERLRAADAAGFARSALYAIEDEWQAARLELERENTK